MKSLTDSTRLSDVFELSKHDRDLDFVDLDLSNDLRLYVDPILLYRSPIQRFNEAHTFIVEFFERAINFVKSDNKTQAELMCRFPDAENMLGIAQTRPGHGPRNKLGYKIYEELVNNSGIQEKGLTFLNEFQLLIEGISYDLISDAAVQISKQVFIDYTQEQCRISKIQLHSVTIGHYFFWEHDEWDSLQNVLLPLNPLKNNIPFLLTPWTMVRRYPEASYEDFYEKIYRYVLLAKERERLWSALGKKPRVSFRDIANKYRVERLKPQIVSFIKNNPEEKDRFFRIIRPVEETAWLEELSLRSGININQLITPTILDSVDSVFPKKKESPVTKSLMAAVNHQLKLIQPRKRLGQELVDFTKKCKEENVVLLLGNYQNPDGYKRLQEILDILSISYKVLVLKRDDNPLPESLIQTVIRFSTLARFTIIEDTYAGGQSVEIDLLKNIGIIAAILREKGKQATYMTVGVSNLSSNFKEIDYDLIPGNGIDEIFVHEATGWAENRYSEEKKYWKDHYPWL